MRRSLAWLCALGLAACPASSPQEQKKGPPGPRATPVRVAPVRVETIEVFADYPGELEADAADLAPKMTGRIEEIRVRIGDPVKKGDLIARIDDGELRRQVLETKAEIKVAEASQRSVSARLRVARSELERTGPLREKNLVSPQHVDGLRAQVATLEADYEVAASQIEQRRARLGLLELQIQEARIVAPFDGTIAARSVDPGAMAQPGKTIARIVAGGPLRVRFRIPERDLVLVRPGQLVEVRTQATGTVAYSGRVSRVAGEVSRADRSVQAEALLETGDEIFRPGMFAEVRARKSRIESATVVPASAVLERVENGQTVTGVFLAEGGTARWLAVDVLERAGDRVAVKGELAEGARVLTLGHEDLGDGARIELSEQSGAEPGKTAEKPRERLAP